MKKKHILAFTVPLLSAGILALMGVSCGFLPEDEENEILDKSGMKLVWSDEFDYEGVPDTSKWKYQTGAGGWGNNELQNYTDNSTTADTASVANGLLTIKAYYKDGQWKSARMNSKASWKYGYIEARVKITDKKGAWPAFWMMPQDSVYGDWPKSGEIDIMENAPAVCGNHRIFSSLHAEGHGGENPVSIGSKTYDENLSNEWHTIGIEWNESKITAYYDDEATGSYQNDGSTKNWPYDQNFYIILNLAIGGNLGGTSAATGLRDSGAEFQIDYVRVYQ
ncbi:glycoside hydrolase family 16 protein [uncultured Treponema sp.]|uniref:glycoside hydrolase family 16 protein n=1 Tax=uncultured Treponema sp. TaxID=162155 RepID=UPI0025F3D328|nr:glycoside hydrolase family 16 protein [uncultured Treponema sp.]